MTRSLDETRIESDRLKALLDSGIRARLLQLPGVFHVCVGAKESGERVDPELCFRVYVRTKLPADQLPRDAIIPEHIEGVRTDVNTVSPKKPTEDNTRYRPIKGGIQITNGHEVPGMDAFGNTIFANTNGTLGCLGTDRRRNCGVFALTNWHVLFIGGGGIGSNIFQPYSLTNRNNTFEANPIHNDTTDVIGRVVDGVINDKVDCGIFSINTSCCNLCEIRYRNEINNLDLDGYSGIRGIARAVENRPVYIVGRTSGRQKGIVTTVDEADFSLPYHSVSDSRVSASDTHTQNFRGQITIRPFDPAIRRFSDDGDSGAVVVNEHSEVVGLLFAADTEPDEHGVFKSSANHISDVLDALRLLRGIEFEVSCSQPPQNRVMAENRATISIPEIVDPMQPEGALLALEQKMNEHPGTRDLMYAVRHHRQETIDLVNHCRPVLVAWRRCHGPEFLASIFDAFLEGKDELPNTIKGIQLHDLLNRMMVVLGIHGSTELQVAINHYGSMILDAVKDNHTFSGIIKNLGTGVGASQ